MLRELVDFTKQKKEMKRSQLMSLNIRMNRKQGEKEKRNSSVKDLFHINLQIMSGAEISCFQRESIRGMVLHCESLGSSRVA